MYHNFYALQEPAFELMPNPKFLFMTARHQEALSNLEYGLSSGKSLTVLIGEAGTGKTTLLHAAFASPSCRYVHRAYVNNPTLTREEFVAVLARQFGLSLEARGSKAVLLAELEQRLTAAAEKGESVALVIDEAQRLSNELLEEVRLLANIETPNTRLLALVLAGQPELASRLNHEDLRQLKQRIALRCHVSAFDLGETVSYIAHRVRTAGGEPLRLFTREAVTLIHERSRGIPRTISVLCENALLSGYAQGVAPVSRAIVLEVCQDFDLGEPVGQAALMASRPTPETPFGDDRPRVLAPTPQPHPAAATPSVSRPEAASQSFLELPKFRGFSLFRR